MSTFTTAAKTFMQDEGGVTAIEYGLIAAMIAVALVAVLTSVRNGLNSTFSSVASALGVTS